MKYIRNIVYYITFMAIMVSCSSSNVYKYPKHESFNEENIKKISLEMKADDVEYLFGAPDEEFEVEYGNNTDDKWIGITWLYFTDIDKNYTYVKRYKKNSFVFLKKGHDLQLINYTIE